MIHLVAENADQYYKNYMELFNPDTIHGLSDCLYESSPRGMKVREVIGVSQTLLDPRERFLSCDVRRWPFRSYLAEVLWYLSADNSVSLIKDYLPVWERFSDNGITVNSNYGAHWHDAVLHCIDLLKKDRDTRRAAFSIYGNDFLTRTSKDVPCTFSVQFFIRNERLHMVVFNRSRDVVRGECGGDMFAFTVLQELVANELEIDVGNYTAHHGSLHVYEEHFNLIGNYRFNPEKFKWVEESPHRRHLWEKYSTFWDNIETDSYVRPSWLFEGIENRNIDWRRFRDAHDRQIQMRQDVEEKLGILDLRPVGLEKDL